MLRSDKGGRKRRGRAHRRREGWLGEDGRAPARHGRPFQYGQLRLAILQWLADKPSHGYEIIKAIEERTAGAYVPSPGVVYPTLAMLEDMGCIAAGANADNRKLYKITPSGRKYLADHKTALEEVNARLNRVAAMRGQVEAPQIVRAMSNLKTALRLKLAAAALSTAQLQALAAILDAAAAQIEQL